VIDINKWLLVAVFLYCLLDALSGFIITKAIWSLLSPHLGVLLCSAGSLMVLPMVKIGPFNIPVGFGSDEIFLGVLFSTLFFKIASKRLKTIYHFLLVLLLGFLAGFITIKVVGLILVSISGVENCLEEIPVVGFKWSWFDRAFWLLTIIATIKLAFTVKDLWKQTRQS